LSLNNSNFFCSWSGGKDSCLALYRSIKEGNHPKALLTMLVEDGQRSRSHGLPIHIIEEQAKVLGVPLRVCSASWSNYEENFTNVLKDLKNQGIEAGVFGDIDIEDHQKWVQKVCSKVQMDSYHPLWKEARRSLLMEFISLGFKATIVAVKEGVLDKSFLGKILDESLVLEIEKLGVDACGEEGEFHTVVTDGPIFSSPINIKLKDYLLIDGYWFQDLE
jgi:diphthine-ammonia ligase